MSRRIRRLLLGATVFSGVLLSGTAAHAGPLAPVFAALGSALGATGLAGVLARVALGIALNVGVGLLERAFQPKQKKAGVSAQMSTGGDNPLSFMIGDWATPGQLEYVNTWGSAGGTPNAYLTLVISLADLPLALTGLWVNDKKVTLPDMSGDAPYTQGWPVAEYAVNGSNNLWLRYYDGSQTLPDQFLINTFGSDADRPWSADMIGRGVPYAILTAQFNTGLFSSSVPSFLFESSGISLYDIRQDSTAGGVGTQRWDDPGTWAPSDNPFVQIYNIVRGIMFAGALFYGGTATAYQLPASVWMAAMNEADALVDLADGSQEKQFRTGYEVTVDKSPADVIDDILKAACGRIAEVGGSYKVLCGTPTAPVFSITDDTIVVTQGQTLDPFPSEGDTYNGASATYTEPSEKWGTKAAPIYTRPDLEALDQGQQRLADLALAACAHGVQAQRVQKFSVDDARRFRKHTFCGPPLLWLLEPLDCLSYMSERNGYEDKKFLLGAISGSSGFLQTMSLQEIDPSDYSWSGDDQLPYSVGTVGPINPPKQPMVGWLANPYTAQDASGIGRRPAIQVGYAGKLVDVAQVRIQVRLTGTTGILFDGTVPYGDPTTNADEEYQIVSFASIINNTQYDVRGVFISSSGRAALWSNESLAGDGSVVEGAWITVTTPDVQVTTDDIAANAITELKIAAQAISTAKLQVAAVTADILADQAVLGSKLADAAVSSSKLEDDAVIASKIAAASIDTTKFAAGITPVEIGSSLPTTGNFAGRTFFDASGGKTYTYTNGEWTTPIFDIGPGTITGDMIANAAITASKLLDGAVTSTKIQAGAVGAGQIAANSIVASKLVLTDFTNLVPDNQMLDAGAWGVNGGWILGAGSSTIGGQRYYQYTSQGNSAYGLPLNSRQFPIDATKTYFFSLNYVAQTAGTVQFLVRLSWRDINNTEISVSDIGAGPTSAGGTLSGQATPPGTAQSAFFQVYGYDPGTTAQLAVALPVVRVMANAELIVDGSITTSKLLAGSVTSDILAANSVVAGKIAAGAVSATQLAAGSITSDKLTVGRATNWIENSDFSAGLARWTWAGTSPNVSVRLRADNLYNVAGHPCFEIYDPNPGDESGNYYDVTPVNADGSVGFPVEPNGYYEVSAYMNNHRCSVGLYCEFIDAAGNHISYGNYTPFPATNTGGDGLLSMFTLRSSFHQAPSNAATARPYFRKVGTNAGGADSYLFMYRCQMAEATANQTEPSPWSPAGITLVTSDVIKTGAVIADSISGGAITAEKLSVGTSGNMIMNSDFLAQSYPGVSVGYDGTAGLPDSNGLGFSPYYPSGMASFYFSYAATPPVGPGGYAQINRPNIDGSLAYFPVVASQTYEFSAYLSIHRCNAYVRLIFFDASNNAVGDFLGNTCAENVVGNTSLGSWSRSWVIAPAPSTATKCIGRVQMIGNGGTNPYVFYTGLYLSQANPNQSTPSPWSPAGATAIDGNQVITNSLYASKIVAGSITADKIGANAVTAAAIAAGSITGDKLIAQSLSALGITVGTADIVDAAISSIKLHDAEVGWLEAA